MSAEINRSLGHMPVEGEPNAGVFFQQFELPDEGVRGLAVFSLRVHEQLPGTVRLGFVILDGTEDLGTFRAADITPDQVQAPATLGQMKALSEFVLSLFNSRQSVFSGAGQLAAEDFYRMAGASSDPDIQKLGHQMGAVLSTLNS